MYKYKYIDFHPSTPFICSRPFKFAPSMPTPPSLPLGVSPDILRQNQQLPILPIPPKATVIKTDKPRPHICPLCTRGFVRHEHLKRHVRSHTNEKPYSCIVCGRSFARRDLLLRHEKKLHGVYQGPRSRKRNLNNTGTKDVNMNNQPSTSTSGSSQQKISDIQNFNGLDSTQNQYDDTNPYKNHYALFSSLIPSSSSTSTSASANHGHRSRHNSFSATSATTYTNDREAFNINQNQIIGPTTEQVTMGFSTPQLQPQESFDDDEDLFDISMDNHNNSHSHEKKRLQLDHELTGCLHSLFSIKLPEFNPDLFNNYFITKSLYNYLNDLLLSYKASTPSSNLSSSTQSPSMLPNNLSLPKVEKLNYYLLLYFKFIDYHLPMLSFTDYFSKDEVPLLIVLCCLGSLFSKNDNTNDGLTNNINLNYTNNDAIKESKNLFEISRRIIHVYLSTRKKNLSINIARRKSSIGNLSPISNASNGSSRSRERSETGNGNTNLNHQTTSKWLLTTLTLSVWYGLLSNDNSTRQIALSQVKSLIHLVMSSLSNINNNDSDENDIDNDIRDTWISWRNNQLKYRIIWGISIIVSLGINLNYSFISNNHLNNYNLFNWNDLIYNNLNENEWKIDSAENWFQLKFLNNEYENGLNGNPNEHEEHETKTFNQFINDHLNWNYKNIGSFNLYAIICYINQLQDDYIINLLNNNNLNINDHENNKINRDEVYKSVIKLFISKCSKIDNNNNNNNMDPYDAVLLRDQAPLLLNYDLNNYFINITNNHKNFNDKNHSEFTFLKNWKDVKDIIYSISYNSNNNIIINNEFNESLNKFKKEMINISIADSTNSSNLSNLSYLLKLLNLCVTIIQNFQAYKISCLNNFKNLFINWLKILYESCLILSVFTESIIFKNVINDQSNNNDNNSNQNINFNDEFLSISNRINTLVILFAPITSNSNQKLNININQPSPYYNNNNSNNNANSNNNNNNNELSIPQFNPFDLHAFSYNYVNFLQNNSGGWGNGNNGNDGINAFPFNENLDNKNTNYINHIQSLNFNNNINSISKDDNRDECTENGLLQNDLFIKTEDLEHDKTNGLHNISNLNSQQRQDEEIRKLTMNNFNFNEKSQSHQNNNEVNSNGEKINRYELSINLLKLCIDLLSDKYSNYDHNGNHKNNNNNNGKRNINDIGVYNNNNNHYNNDDEDVNCVWPCIYVMVDVLKQRILYLQQQQ